MLNRHVYVLIMAGGEGVRFAPLSTPDKPKQFHNIIGNKSLLRQTFERVLSSVSPDRISVLTNERYATMVSEHIPEIPTQNIHREPVKKNTAPCIAYSAAWVHANDPEGVMVILPSDHVILDKIEFEEVLKSGVELATKEKALVTFGIVPTWASPDYGYIKRLNLVSSADRPAYWVEKFVEKPNEETAAAYIDSGQYYWNSGMFVWQASVILAAIAKHIPGIYNRLKELNFKKGQILNHDSIADFFNSVDAISIDYGVMEREKNVITIPCSFGWSDIGTWSGLKSLYDQGQIVIDPTIRDIMETECRR